MPEIILNWIKSFLTERRKRVKLGSFSSNWRTINGGVPQAGVEKVGTAGTDGRRHILEQTTFLQAHFVIPLKNELYGIKFSSFFIILNLICILFSH